MNSSALSVFIRKSAAVATMLGVVAMGAPFIALADTPPPLTVTLSSSVSGQHTAKNPIPVTVTFSEGVVGFTAGDIHVDNGSVTGFASSSATVYTFGIIPGAPSGSVSANINGGMVTGVDGQPNEASNQIQFIIDANAGDAAPATNVSTQAFLSLSNFSGPAGTVFNAIGTQFDGLEVVNIGFFGTATTSTTTLADGSFSVPFTAITGQSGATQLTAIGATSGLVATSTFFVQPASTTATTTTTASTTIPVGGTVSTGPNAPVITITSGPTDGSTVSTPLVTFEFTVNDPMATLTCTLGSTFGCGSPVTLGPLGDSLYAFSVTAASSTGISTTTVNFLVDTSAVTTPPPTTTTTPTPVVSSGGGGGGGGGVISGPLSIGYVNNSQAQGAGPVVTTQGNGQVLGVSTYNFTRPLNVGSRGGDVTQLQTILIADGFLMIANPTGYFGPLTLAAVKLYQQAHGLPQVGNVGPLTRAMLNKGQ